MTIDTSTAEKSSAPTDYKAAMMYHSDRCDALSAERDAAVAMVAELQRRQTYRYIGKDGVQILARDLEDQRDAAVTALTQSRADGVRQSHNGIAIWITGRNSEGDFWLHLKESNGKSGGINLGNPAGMIVTSLLAAAAIPKGGAE